MIAKLWILSMFDLVIDYIESYVVYELGLIFLRILFLKTLDSRNFGNLEILTSNTSSQNLVMDLGFSEYEGNIFLNIFLYEGGQAQ